MAHAVVNPRLVGAKMNFYQHVQRNDRRVKVYNDSFGVFILWSERCDPSLLNFSHSFQVLEYRFGAPVTAAAETDPLFR